MIHRALFGSIERFFGILLEHYAGALPGWLSPVQATIVPVADRHLDYATQVADDLRAAGLRVRGRRRRRHRRREDPPGDHQQAPGGARGRRQGCREPAPSGCGFAARNTSVAASRETMRSPSSQELVPAASLTSCPASSETHRTQVNLNTLRRHVTLPACRTSADHRSSLMKTLVNTLASAVRRFPWLVIAADDRRFDGVGEFRRAVPACRGPERVVRSRSTRTGCIQRDRRAIRCGNSAAGADVELDTATSSRSMRSRRRLRLDESVRSGQAAEFLVDTPQSPAVLSYLAPVQLAIDAGAPFPRPTPRSRRSTRRASNRFRRSSGRSSLRWSPTTQTSTRPPPRSV